MTARLRSLESRFRHSIRDHRSDGRSMGNIPHPRRSPGYGRRGADDDGGWRYPRPPRRHDTAIARLRRFHRLFRWSLCLSKASAAQMSGERVDRRLLAILAADVVGYSRLMGEDEEGTLAALKTLQRELFAPKVKEHCGRLVKTTGDGALVEFASVIDAVRCAAEIQRAMAERN